MKLFQRKKENFICDNCGKKVVGNGYTNHCPVCLWSKHIDINPGDRKEKCLGMMAPVAVDIKSGVNSIIHECVKCNFRRKNKVVKEDDFEEFIKISRKASE